MDLLEITRFSGGPVLDSIRWLQGENCLAIAMRECYLPRGTKTTLMVTMVCMFGEFFSFRMFLLLYGKVEFITLRILYCKEKPTDYFQPAKCESAIHSHIENVSV